MMDDQRETVGTAQGLRVDLGFQKPQVPTLAEAGIDKNLAKEARAAAAIPGADFERMIDEGRRRISEETDRASKRIFNEGERPSETGGINPPVNLPTLSEAGICAQRSDHPVTQKPSDRPTLADAGEMMEAQPKAKASPGNQYTGPGYSQPQSNFPPTLAEAGIR
jgi:hypothetical protein